MTDNTHLPELTRRQEEILSLVVRSYTQNPEPVSSKTLRDTYDLSYSAATVRNEMSTLEDLGYLKAPHTSAGRAPTEMGYRYFVRRIMDDSTQLSMAERSYIADNFRTLPLAIEQWLRHAAMQLARTAHTASLVTPPVAEQGRFKHVELIAIQGRLVLMVLVLHSGSVHQQMLNLAEPMAQDTLSEVAGRLNKLCLSLSADEVRMKGIQLTALERDITELAADVMNRANNNQPRVIYRDGLSEALGTFGHNQGAQQAVRVYEESALLRLILSDMAPQAENDVQIVIAGDGRWEELSHLSMVLSRYGIPGEASGALGVVGPTHIDYGRAVTAVRYIAGLMTEMLKDLYQEPDENKPNF